MSEVDLHMSESQIRNWSREVAHLEDLQLGICGAARPKDQGSKGWRCPGPFRPVEVKSSGWLIVGSYGQN